jgi:aryl-alcohol dehydrogenase-like predicted oxidoreductase
MEYRILGRSGIKVSPLCLGTDNFANPTPEKESARMIARAMDAGINIIDTSNSYMQGESERIIGRALAESGRRHEMIIATKVHYPVGPGPNDRGNSRLHILKACEDSLKRLQTDTIDLYQTHRPDFDVPLEETLGAMTDLVRQGKVRYIGSSTAPAWKVMEGIMVSELKGFSRCVSEQPPYNLLDRRIENELVPLCRRYNLGILPYADRVTPRAVTAGNRFVALAKEIGLPPAQLAILWNKDQPGITAPIIGPRTMDQLEHLLPVLEMTLEDSVREACDEFVPPGSAVADFHNSAPWMKMQL